MPLGIGELPKEYNVKVHGPYDPAIFYGKKDTPFGQVKLGELPAWLSRRSYNPIDWGRACSRAYWRWCHRFVLPKYVGLTPIYQAAAFMCFSFYILSYPRLKHHRNEKYHW